MVVVDAVVVVVCEVKALVVIAAVVVVTVVGAGNSISDLCVCVAGKGVHGDDLASDKCPGSVALLEWCSQYWVLYE